MKGEHATIPATDGLPIAATIHHPEKAKAWCTMASATGVRRRYYQRFARHLAGRGITTVTFDYRGIGDTPAQWQAGDGQDTGPPTMRAWGERDLEGVLRWVAEKGPRRQFHVGHSAGGQLLGLCPSNLHVEAAVAVASQAGYWRNWDDHRGLMWWLWHVILPASTRLRGHFPSPWFGMGERLPKTVALEWARWCRHPDFIVDADGRPLREHFRAWQGRMRAIAVTDDTRFAPRRAAEVLMSFYENADTEVVDLDPADLGLEEIGHFGFFKRGCEAAWDGVAAWLLRDAG